MIELIINCVVKEKKGTEMETLQVDQETHEERSIEDIIEQASIDTNAYNPYILNQ